MFWFYNMIFGEVHNDHINVPNYGLWDRNIQRFINIHDIFTSEWHRFNQSSHVKLLCWGRRKCLAHAQIFCKQKYDTIMIVLDTRDTLNGLLWWLEYTNILCLAHSLAILFLTLLVGHYVATIWYGLYLGRISSPLNATQIAPLHILLFVLGLTIFFL